MLTKFWSENLKQGAFLEDLDLHERIILKWSLKKNDAKVWARFVDSGCRPVARFCEHGTEHLSSVRGEEFLD
jgi:hypothetical protein